MSCPDCGWHDVRYHRLLNGWLEVICGWCEATLTYIEVDYASA